jgi:hypothetical protein
MAARQPLLTFLPLATSLISLILVLLILLAGTNNTLSSLYYLKVRLPDQPSGPTDYLPRY